MYEMIYYRTVQTTKKEYDRCEIIRNIIYKDYIITNCIRNDSILG